MNEWIDELTDLCAADEPAVLVTVAGIRGSAPREIGAKMIVTAAETIGTIGGGQLEYQCTRIAVGLLHDFDYEQHPIFGSVVKSTKSPCCKTRNRMSRAWPTRNTWMRPIPMRPAIAGFP